MTDSQKEMAAIVEEAAEVGASRGYEQQRLVTPTPVSHLRRSGDSAEMHAIARDEVERNRPNEWVLCEKEGPAFKLGLRIDRVDTHLNHVDERVLAMELERREERGATKEIAKQAASRTAMQTVLISGAVAIISLLLSFGLNRYFPPSAHASPAVNVGHP
jgi:hypothetical protein